MTVPEHLRPVLKQNNLTKRLGTKSKAQAKRLAPEHILEFQKRLAEAELGRNIPPPAIDVMEALRAIDRWAADERQRVLPEAFATGGDVQLSVAFDWKKGWGRIEHGHVPAIVMVDPGDAALLAALHAQGFTFRAGASIPSSIRSEFARTCGRLEHEVNVTRGGSREFLDGLSGGSSRAVAVGSSLPSVWRAFEGWREKRERGGLDAGKSAREFETQIKRFIDVHGDVPLSRVTNAHCIEFRNLMSHYPARPMKEQREKPIRELVATLKASGTPYSTLTPKTLNDTVLAAVKAVFADAFEGHGLPNPMAGVAVNEPSKATPSRLPYSGDDIRGLFGAVTFTGPLVDNEDAAGDAQRWVPILAAFTGARLEELAQLAVTDIKAEGDLQFVQFQEAYDGPDPGFKRSLKNGSSHRYVPIHSVLIRLGFLEFVERQRADGQVHLFPKMKWSERKKRDKSYKVSQRFTNWWAATSRAIVPDSKKSFHSFRHTVTQRLRNAGVEEALVDALTGHATPGQGARYGRNREGGKYSLPVLASAIERLAYSEIDVDVLRRQAFPSPIG